MLKQYIHYFRFFQHQLSYPFLIITWIQFAFVFLKIASSPATMVIALSDSPSDCSFVVGPSSPDRKCLMSNEIGSSLPVVNRGEFSRHVCQIDKRFRFRRYSYPVWWPVHGEGTGFSPSPTVQIPRFFFRSCKFGPASRCLTSWRHRLCSFLPKKEAVFFLSSIAKVPRITCVRRCRLCSYD